MLSENPDIIILRGAPGSGKSQTAKSLSQFFPKGVRMEIDDLRSMVIFPEWTNQDEHINILNISTKLVIDFIQLEFRPVIVIDTFSGDKILNYLEKLNHLNDELSISIFGLYTTEEELKKRIESRKKGEFRDFNICKKLNDEVLKIKYEKEFQINTTGLLPNETAKIIYNKIMK
ncbi:AAA domain protein [uncultured archaeon]|nr:AAA domain protein [uncultured archaeon]